MVYLVKRFSCLLAIMLTLTSLLGCAKTENESDSSLLLDREGDSTVYSLATAVKGDVVSTASINCTYRQVHEQQVSISVSGMVVDQVHVKKGDTVKPGDLLIEMKTDNIKDRIDELNYSIARNQLLLTQNEENLANELEARTVLYDYHSEKSSADWVQKEEDMEDIRQKYRYLREDYSDAIALDQEELATLQAEYEMGRVCSGLSGTIASVKSDLEGQIVKKDDVLVTIIDGSECLFETEAPEYVEYFQEGVAVPMTILSNNAKGDYKLVPYQMENWEEVQTFEVVEQPEGVNLEVNVSGKITILLGQRDNVLTVPSQAVHTADDQYYVYMVDENQMRKVVLIEVGLLGDESAEILSGLSEGDKVIL